MFPPHRAYFTDTIIGSVVQQDEDFHHSTVIRNRRRADVASRPYGLLPSAASLRTTPSAPSNRLPSITGLTRYHSDALIVGVIDTKIKKMKLVSATSDRFDNDASKNERQRQKNRMHQASYKMRQRKLVAGLEDSLKKLKEEIPELESQQLVLSYGQTNATIWSIAAEYFRLFRHGVKHSVVSTTGKESLLTYKTPKSSQFQAQWHFMETAMAHDICNGVVSGIQALMDNLIFLSKCYEEFDLRPLRMDNVSENVLNVTTRCEIIITENTLRYGFPDLIKNGKHSSLAGKILGEKIIVNGSMRFVRDNMSGQITRLQWKSDLLTPLLRLFGSLEAVSHLFNGAQLSPDGNISPFVIGTTDS